MNMVGMMINGCVCTRIKFMSDVVDVVRNFLELLSRVVVKM